MNRRLSALIPFISALAAAGCSNSIAGAGDTAGAGGAAAGSASTTGGTVGVAGSPVTSGGADVAGGSPTTSAGTTGVGGVTGGAPTGGSSTGGSTGGGTAPGGAGGTVGAAGGGTAGAPSTITISGTTDGPFNNSFMITACGSSGSGYDCPNTPPGGNCSSAKWSYEASSGTVSTQENTGISSSQVFDVTGGDPTKTYDVTVHVEGQAEGRTYVNGMAHSASVTPAQEKNDMLYIGGQPGPDRTDYNVFQMVITGGTPVPGAPTYYAFNATAQAFQGEHHNYSVDETFTFKVKSGQKLTFTNHDSNCISIKNCGGGGNIYGFGSAAECESHARATPADVTLPATFHGVTITNPTHFQTQFLNFKVTGIVAE